ncbi:MAG: chorismate synthase [Bacteroidia bacterium]|nr:chorismate synthase [Bacteroidia bacterium]MDW8133441.1 chorismate synthase [Bacteroidia bacterium]
MNTFGRAFRITTFGESHGVGIGVVIDGLPGNLPIDITLIQKMLARRRPGQSQFTSSRSEPDEVEVLSGLYQGRSTGAPLTLWIANRDARPEDYSALAEVYRPSHADFTYHYKYANPDPRGGGRSSARETVARVAAGAVALQLLQHIYPELRLIAWTAAIGPYASSYEPVSIEEVEKSPVRCPDLSISALMEAYLQQLREEGDTTGGIIAVKVEGVPVGLGEPIYDKLSARLAYAMFSINAVKGFEMGEGFGSSQKRGSAHNDLFIVDELGHIRPATNNAGGALGGITSGAPLLFRVAFKPVATLRQPQRTVSREGKPVVVAIEGRHDPCPVPRAVPIVEAMTAIVLADFALLARASAHF